MNKEKLLEWLKTELYDAEKNLYEAVDKRDVLRRTHFNSRGALLQEVIAKVKELSE